MPLPSYTVEISFGSSSYVDVSAYVQSITLDRGISNQLEDYSAGSISITFVNNNRVFDPLNTSSPLWYATDGYTIVQPGGRVRVSANGIRRFTGFIQDWSFSFDEAGLDGRATLFALDEMYRVSNAVFTGGQAWQVEATSDRIKTVMNYNGFSAPEYAGVESGQTLLGYDEWQAGDSVLSYLQNVARSEPADFFSNSSAVMVFKDRSFTNYSWSNTMRYNFVSYPSTATTSPGATGVLQTEAGGTYNWIIIGSVSTAVPSQFAGTVFRGGTVDAVLPEEQFVGFQYNNTNIDRYANITAGSVVFSSYLIGISGNYSGFAAFTDSQGGIISSTAFTTASASTATWVRVGTVLAKPANAAGVQFSVGAYGSTAYVIRGEGFQIEPGTAFINYFDGAYDPYEDTATAKYRTAWSGLPYASQSGLLSSTASTVTAPAIHTFADANSQGTAFGNGTGIPFIDLEIAYGSENLYNKVQVIGANATAIVNDSTGQSRYGLKTYSQTDNLTTSTTRPAEIASALLGEFRLPEYRAEQITISLESLTTAQQNIVLGLELRNVVRVCFLPSNMGSVVDKYYQILGISGNADTERDQITLRLASLDNLPFRLDSTLLGLLDTDTLA